jgi:cytidine deaminase
MQEPFILKQNFKNGLPRHQTQTKPNLQLSCGACRQSIAEYETKQDTLLKYFMGEIGEIYKSEILKKLTPFCLRQKNSCKT